MPRAEFTARYRVESPDPLERVAEVIAGEQSSGTHLPLAGETAALKERSRARVVAIEPLEDVDAPSLRSAWVERHAHRASDGDLAGRRFRRGDVTIAFPIANVGANLSTLLATIAGNLFELGEVTGLRLLDVDLPADFAAAFPRPAFGVDGTRRLAGVHGRPILGTIVKPSIGLTPAQTAELVDALCAGGIDFVKDDELIADPPYAPFEARLRAVMPVLHRHADRLGRLPMYAINVSGAVDDMRRRHDAVLAAGGTCVMASVHAVGFAAVEDLRRHSQLPIHGHRNGWGMLTREPSLGVDFAAWQKLWRLAGVDHLHVNGVRSKFWEPDDSVIRSARACLAPWAGVRPAMPVFSSGQWAGQAPDLYEALGATDCMHLAGGGIIGHPDGIGAGVASLREGWAAAVAGVSLDEHAKTHPALAAAIAAFGTRDG